MLDDFRICVIFPAAGSSRRFNEGDALLGADVLGRRSKLDEDLGGRPVLQRTVELFIRHPDVCQTIVAGPHDDDAFSEFKLRHADRLELLGTSLCRGGATHRWETVRAALAYVNEGITHVAVHDAARPCASPGLIELIFATARGHGAVIPVVEVADTIKRLGDAAAVEADPLADILSIGPGVGERGGSPLSVRQVTGTVDRAGLALVQTPQVFDRSLLERAYAQGDLSSTDDAGLIERLGEPVMAVPGEATNLKITRREDIELARMILKLPKASERTTPKKF